MDANLMGGGDGGTDRKMARQRQLEEMELAAGRHGASSMDESADVNFDPPSGAGGGSFRDVGASASSDSGNIAGASGYQYDSRLPPPGGVGSGANIFEKRDHIYEVDQSVNLMDPMATSYERPGDRASRMNPISALLYNFFGDGSRRMLVLLVAFALIIMISIGVHNAKGSSPSGAAYTKKDIIVPPDERNKLDLEAVTRDDALLELILDEGISKKEKFDDITSPQARALQWITDADPLQLRVTVANLPIILQRYALAVLYYSTRTKMGGQAQNPSKPNEITLPDITTEWTHHTNWLTGNNYCNWYGVSCISMEDITGGTGTDVIRLNLTANNLVGTIPSEIKAFEQMRECDLSINKLKGTIPNQFYRMFHLRYLILSDNELTGTINEEISMFEGARDIFLNKNKLSGSIPTGINRLFNLRGFYVDHNELTGEIPDMRGMRNLAFLHMHNNKIKSRFPFSLSQMRSLFDLRVQANQLSGTIPPEFDNLENLEVFYAGYNNLGQAIPNVFETLTRLVDLRLQSNDFTGEIPETLAKATNLKHLVLDGNKLNGNVPTQLGELTELQTLILSNNTIAGAIPTELGNIPSLKELWLDHNYMFGALPTELSNCSNLEKLFLEHNAFENTIPNMYNKLHNLVNFRAETNQLTGDVPQGICNLKGASGSLDFISLDCKSEITCSCCDQCF